MQVNFVKCCHCGEVLERFGDRCPRCGKNPKRQWASVFGWLIVLTVALGLVVAFAAYARRVTDEAASRTKMLASVRASMMEVEITNLNDQAWTKVAITVNDEFVYRFPIGVIDRMKPATFPLIQFVARDGRRFEPDRLAVKRVSIEARHGEGEKADSIEGSYSL